MKPQRILLIEPNRDIADIMVELLKSIGKEVKVIQNVDVLISNTSFENYDMIIVDTDNLCSFNYELAKRRRERSIKPLLYIIGCYCIQDSTRQLIQLGVDGVYVKPIDLNEMMFDIERVLMKPAI